jgi:PST family polysaccharide transporter
MLATPWYLVCAVYAIPAAVLRRRLDFGRLARLDLVNSTVRAGGSIVFAAAGLGAGSLVLGSLTSSVACLVLALTFVRVPWPRWNAAAVRDLLPYGGPAALACLAWTGFRNGDYAVVGARLGAAQAGFYWRGYQLAVEYQKKISVLMTQMAFPVLARTAGADEMFELRRRIVQLATVALFPMLVLLALLAPAVVPWLFGPAWEPAVVPCQILAAGGAATLVIDAVGSSLMAEGRSRALLGFGVAHFVVYIGAVVAVAGHGLAAVAVTAVVVHTLFVGVAYELLFRHHARPSLVLLWEDVRAACVASLALAVAALPLDWALRHAGAPVPIELLAVLPVATVAYLAALYAWFPAAWNDLAVSIGRVAPGFVTTRLPGPAGRRRALEPASAPE